MFANRYVKFLIIILVLLYTIMGGHIHCCIHFCTGKAVQAGEESDSCSSCSCSHSKTPHTIHSHPIHAHNDNSLCQDSTETEQTCDGAQPMLNLNRNLLEKVKGEILGSFATILDFLPVFQSTLLTVDNRETGNFCPKMRLHLFFGSLLL